MSDKKHTALLVTDVETTIVVTSRTDIDRVNALSAVSESSLDVVAIDPRRKMRDALLAAYALWGPSEDTYRLVNCLREHVLSLSDRMDKDSHYGIVDALLKAADCLDGAAVRMGEAIRYLDYANTEMKSAEISSESEQED